MSAEGGGLESNDGVRAELLGALREPHHGRAQRRVPLVLRGPPGRRSQFRHDTEALLDAETGQRRQSGDPAARKCRRTRPRCPGRSQPTHVLDWEPAVVARPDAVNLAHPGARLLDEPARTRLHGLSVGATLTRQQELRRSGGRPVASRSRLQTVDAGLRRAYLCAILWAIQDLNV